ncbi:MAG: hypothetical protein AB7U20_16385 [Planctomycetaceae bacterium]
MTLQQGASLKGLLLSGSGALSEVPLNALRKIGETGQALGNMITKAAGTTVGQTKGLPGSDAKFVESGHREDEIQALLTPRQPRAEMQHPDAAQRGTSQAYSAILKAVRGAERQKELKTLQ